MIKTKNTLEAWKTYLNYILQKGNNFIDENNRICREVLNLTVTIEQPSKDIDQPIQILNKLHKWDYPSVEKITQATLARKTSSQYSYSHSSRMFSYQNTLNQIDDYVIPLLQHAPTTRRAVMLIWDALKDSKILRKDIPAMIFIDFKIRNNQMHTTGILRSNDAFFGWPANILQIHAIHQYVGKKINCETGTITTTNTSAHIFKEQIPYIETVLQMKN
jgi:thymidylate synthase